MTRPERLRPGLLVTSNRFRPPAMLAKIAATVGIVFGGRPDFGIGAGSRPGHPLARREYDAHGLPFHDSAQTPTMATVRWSGRLSGCCSSRP